MSFLNINNFYRCCYTHTQMSINAPHTWVNYQNVYFQALKEKRFQALSALLSYQGASEQCLQMPSCPVYHFVSRA